MTITRDQFLEFIRKKKEQNLPEEKLSNSTKYYLRKFDSNGSKNIFCTPNWSAFFFCYAWMIYRRMYLYMFLYLLSLVVVLVAAVFLILTFQNLVVILLMTILLIMGAYTPAIWGTSLYIRFAKKKIKKGITRMPPRLWPALLFVLGSNILLVVIDILRSTT